MRTDLSIAGRTALVVNSVERCDIVEMLVVVHYLISVAIDDFDKFL